ncbi:MAG: hypothetical protein H8D24_00430 [Gammaproteobacteria bacterium]|uniref:Uncharacterized protein n=1 Tax=Candidatus Thiopontia autotrophica TaxID=2841688 RepID=A0A8J6NY20_9GAMM|nr:hypothetical protein [Candidatus Thiopontia autotrophica]
MINQAVGIVAIITIVLTLNGCTTNPALVKSESESYRTGFAHGCDSRAVDNNPYYLYQRDVKKYGAGADAEYTHGWDDAYKRCAEKGTLTSFFTHEEAFLHDAIEDLLP